MLNGSPRIVVALFCLVMNMPALGVDAETLPLPNGCEMAGRNTGPRPADAPNGPAFPPVQLEVRTPFEPTVFPAGGYNYLIYELHLQNFTEGPLTLRGLEVLDAAGAENEPMLRSLVRSFLRNLSQSALTRSTASIRWEPAGGQSHSSALRSITAAPLQTSYATVCCSMAP